MSKERDEEGERRVSFFPHPLPASSTYLLSPHFSRGQIALAPFFARPECEKALSRGPISFGSRTGTLAAQAKP